MAKLPGFGERLRHALAQRGITQADLARATGKSSGSVVRWMRGEIPELETLQTVARATAVPMQYLLLGPLAFDELATLQEMAREHPAAGATPQRARARTSAVRAHRSSSRRRSA